MEQPDYIQTVEINGMKLDVDLRTAKKIENYKIGDRVKVLVKDYSSSYKPHPGVIVAFDMFDKLPTITVAYMDISYAGAEIKFAYINSAKEDDGPELAPYNDDILVDKGDVIAKLDGEVLKKKAEIEDIELKKQYFISKFNAYFQPSSEDN